MPIPTGVVYARAGLLGNPSDGYGGKALACTVRNFAARVGVEASGRCAIEASGERVEFASPDDLRRAAASAEMLGLPGLVHAAWRRFVTHFDVPASVDPITLACQTTIPREVGLAGSSAVIIATFRALAEHHQVTPSPFELAEQALATELDDLGISAGAMDRVIQSYGGVMVMDLAPPRTEASYRRIDPRVLPDLLVAWDPRGGTPSGVAHGDLRRRWLAGDPDVLTAIGALRDLVDRGVEALERGNLAALPPLFEENFAWRCRIFPVGERDRRMVETARRVGGAAKLCGSGGAIVAVQADGELAAVARALEDAGYRVARADVG